MQNAFFLLAVGAAVVLTMFHVPVGCSNNFQSTSDRIDARLVSEIHQALEMFKLLHY